MLKVALITITITSTITASITGVYEPDVSPHLTFKCVWEEMGNTMFLFPPPLNWTKETAEMETENVQ